MRTLFAAVVLAPALAAPACKPQRGRHYRVRYTTFAGVRSFRVWVRRA